MGTVSAAAVIAALAFLPIAQWVRGAAAGGYYQRILSEWMSGTAIALGFAVVLVILARGIPALWQDGAGRRLASAAESRGAWVALTATLAYVACALRVFGGRPLMIDEILQQYQAWIFTQGALALPTPAHPEFFTALHVVEHAGRTFTHFPPGWPAMLAVGLAAGVPWLVGPLCGGVAVLAWWIFLREEEPSPAVRGGALVLIAFAPFMAFMSGTQMNHTPTLMWIMVGAAALVRGMRSATPRASLALVAGLGFGAAATMRPVDALAFALPAALWYLWRAIREPARWADALAAAAGVAIPVLLLLWYNARTTGGPLTFGYELLWGRNHGLGFHPDPYGEMHTPARGLGLVSAYLLGLQRYLYEWPVPSLLAPLLALGLWRARLRAGDRYLLASGALLLLLYMAYWFDGVYLGPRFVFCLVPVAALWTARLPAAVRERFGDGTALRMTMYSFLVAGAIGLLLNIPLRAREYARSLPTERWDADGAAREQGVTGALVLVRESWGSKVIARLWGLGISRSRTETLYRRTDTCILDQVVASLEHEGTRGEVAWQRLTPLMRDSLRVARSTLSPDGTERMLPGSWYPPGCVQQILADRGGYTHHMPLLNAHAMGNLYARELGPRDTLLLQENPGRPVYLLTGLPPRPGTWSAPRFVPLQRDSLLAAARAAAAAPQ